MPKRQDELTSNFSKTDNGVVVTTTLSSGILSSDASVIAESGILVAIIAYTDGISDVTVTVYDNASAASGNVLGKIKVRGEDGMGGELRINALVTNGIYITISGNNGEALIRYIT
jgi:hypothetical protein